MRNLFVVFGLLLASSMVQAQTRSENSDAESASISSKSTPRVSAGSNGLIFSTADGADSLRVHGYVQADDRMFSSNLHGEGLDTFLFRRIRPLFEGTLFNAVDFRFMPDFGQNNPQIQEAYFEWKTFPFAKLRVGKFKEPIGLEIPQPATAQGPTQQSSSQPAAGDSTAAAIPVSNNAEPAATSESHLVADTVLSPLGGYGTAPPPATGPYDAPDFSPLTQLNQRLPKWIQFGLEERFRWESYYGGGFKPNNDDSYFLNRVRFGAIIQPTSWLKLLAQMQDARPFLRKPPVGPPDEVRWDLKQAYIELGAPETSPVSLRVGRQIIDYNSTIFGNSEWRNQGRSYDAAVMNIHVDRYRLGIFAASIVNPLDVGISHHLQGNNVYGLYGGIERVIPKSVLEPFLLWRVAPKVAVETTSKSKTGRLDEKAIGFRLRGREIHNFDYRFEVIGEGGSAGTNDIRAWATTFGIGYRFISLRGVPRIFAGYDFASGDKDPTDGVHNTFDLMYPNAHDRFGITDQFGWQNIRSYRGGVTVRLHRRLSLVGQYLDFRLANAKDGIYNVSGGLIARDTTGSSGTHVGESLETYAWYELNRRISLGAGIGHIFPSTFLRSATQGASYTYPYIVVNFMDGKRLLEVP